MFVPVCHYSTARFPLAALAAVFLFNPHTALALESDWTEASHAQARLIADSANDMPRAGIEIRLEKDWHTYWRYPGDSGVPPHFDWTGSENLASAEVQWPAPQRFLDESGAKSIGYHDHVVFPVAIKAVDPAQPVKLHLKMDFAVCEKLCVPASAEINLDVPPGNSDLSETLEQAVSLVPRRAAIGEPSALLVKGINIEHGVKPRAIISIVAPQDTAPVLFAEGPTDQWALPLPEKIDEKDGVTRFSLPFEGAPPGAKPIPKKLVITAVADTEAIEVEITLE